MDSDTSKDDSTILNYDLARYSDYEDYISVSFFVKGQARTLFIPADYIDKRTPRQRHKAMSRARNLYGLAYHMIDPHKLSDPEAVDTIAKTVAVMASCIIVINLWGIFGLKWKASDEFPAFSLKFDSDICPASDEEAASLASGAAIDRLRAKIEPDLYNESKSTYDASWFVWGHIFFSLLCAIQRDHGIIDAIDPDNREPLFERYQQSDEFGVAFQRASYLWGREIARQWLTNKKPAEWPIEALMEYMEFEPIKDELGSHVATFDLTAAQLEKLISRVKSNNHTAPAKMSYSIKDGKVDLTLSMNTDATPGDLTRLMAEAKKDVVRTHGGRRNIKVADHPEHVKKALGSRYADLMPFLTNVKQDAKTFASADPDSWRSLVLRKYPILNDHCDLLDFDINPYYVPSDPEASYRPYDPWQISVEIAARENIPDYEERSVKPNTLLKAAILPDVEPK